MLEGGYTVEEVDALTGPIIGRPKSATLRTADLVGLDILVNASKTVYDRATDDECRDFFSPPELIQPATGLLNFTEEDNGSVSFESLANPSVLPGSPVSIVDRFSKPVGQSVMRTESAIFTGDTRTTSLMRGVARPLSVI